MTALSVLETTFSILELYSAGYQYKVDFDQVQFLFNQIYNSDNMVNVYISGKIIFDKN